MSPEATGKRFAARTPRTARLVKGNDPWFGTDEGARPTWSGPAHLANVWLSYKLRNNMLKGLGFVFLGNYASENLIINSSTLGKFKLPAYTVLNADIFYDVQKFRLAFNLNNLTNKEYFGGGWRSFYVQKPVNFVATVSFKF